MKTLVNGLKYCLKDKKKITWDLQDMDGDKALSPDGFPMTFFKHYLGEIMLVFQEF